MPSSGQSPRASKLTPVSRPRRAPWYTSLYLKRTDNIRQRDPRGLQDARMLWIDSKDRLVPGFVKPDSEFQR